MIFIFMILFWLLFYWNKDSDETKKTPAPVDKTREVLPGNQ